MERVWVALRLYYDSENQVTNYLGNGCDRFHETSQTDMVGT